jgi:hypothetical protein
VDFCGKAALRTIHATNSAPFCGGGTLMHIHDEGINHLDVTVENRRDIIHHPIPYTCLAPMLQSL